MLDDYEFVVFNDARDLKIRNEINQMCRKCHLFCIEIPQEIHDRPYLLRTGTADGYNHSAVRCANVVQYSLDILGFYHDGLVMIIDSDMFMIHEFSVENYLKNYDLAGHLQLRGDHQEINYVWNGLLFFNMNTLPDARSLNFNCGWVEGVLTDVGGYTYYYFKENPTAKIKYFENMHYIKDFWCTECTQNNQAVCMHHANTMKKCGFSDPLITLAIQSNNSNMEVFLDNRFLHYRAGGNWNNESAKYHEKKTTLLMDFINAQLEL